MRTIANRMGHSLSADRRRSDGAVQMTMVREPIRVKALRDACISATSRLIFRVPSMISRYWALRARSCSSVYPSHTHGVTSLPSTCCSSGRNENSALSLFDRITMQSRRFGKQIA